jgi:Cell Wall Hydrolase
MPDYTNFSEPVLLATCAWKEARGEGAHGCRAVMHDIANRAKAWNQTIAHVILGPNQFTSMSVPSDPEFNLLPPDNDPIYQACLVEAAGVMDGSDPDETNGALYYANLKNIDQNGWFARHIVNDAQRHPVLAIIGSQTFFK